MIDFNNLTKEQKEICQNLGALLLIWTSPMLKGEQSPVLTFKDRASELMVVGTSHIFLAYECKEATDDETKQSVQASMAQHRELFAMQMAMMGGPIDERAAEDDKTH